MADDSSHWVTRDEHVSRRVFLCMLPLIFLGLRWPVLSPEWLYGIAWTCTGILIFLAPPRLKIPVPWLAAGLAFLICSSLGFLPRSWFSIPAWRHDLEALGLDTGGHGFVQARLAAETLLVQCITILVILYLLGHRISQRYHSTVALVFILALAGYAAWAMAIHEKNSVFGFFSNRNHTACVLAIGTIMGFGLFTQAVRQKQPWHIALAVVAVAVILAALMLFNVSRAGIILLAVGFVLLLPLLGRQYIRGHVGMALLIGIGTAVLAFWIVDSRVKERLTETVEKLQDEETAAPATLAAEPSFTALPSEAMNVPMDMRVSIYQDTWKMLRSEPWVGVGPWQFQYVFPQYRMASHQGTDTAVLHPESNWLWLISESGLAAALCVFTGIILVAARALRGAARGQGRALRMAGIVAALLVPIHGIWDVPAHHLGIAWAAGVLLAMTMRPPANGFPEPSKLWRGCWRAVGLGILGMGSWALSAAVTGNPFFNKSKVAAVLDAIQTLYDDDLKAEKSASDTGAAYNPPATDDPLEKALAKTTEVIALLPLENHYHYLRGNLALHYDNKQQIVDQAFAVQRRLAPTSVANLLRQALAASTNDPVRAKAAWKDALKLAGQIESHAPHARDTKTITYSIILQKTRGNGELARYFLDLAGNDPALITIWVKMAPANSLDLAAPNLLQEEFLPEIKAEWLKIWQKRGAKSAVSEFLQSQESGSKH